MRNPIGYCNLRKIIKEGTMFVSTIRNVQLKSIFPLEMRCWFAEEHYISLSLAITSGSL